MAGIAVKKAPQKNEKTASTRLAIAIGAICGVPGDAAGGGGIVWSAIRAVLAKTDR